MNDLPVTINDVKSAANRIAPYIHRTPVLTSLSIDKVCNAELYFKCENFQKTGSFKMRGASNAVFSLDEETAKKGVATHSSGNFAQALSLAARKRGIKAYVVMPENSPQVKKDAVAGYGAEITFCKPTQLAREETLKQVVERTGATFIHPYNNETVIAGQGTAGLELIEQAPRLDALIVPVGGGGLISGNAISFSAMSPDTLVYAAEPAGADDAYRSFRAGEIIPSVNPDTIADGLLTSLGSLTFPIIRELVKDIITVTDERIIAAMRLIWERMKIIVEPSAAVTLGAVLTQPELFTGKRVGLLLSGGNVDLTKLPW